MFESLHRNFLFPSLNRRFTLVLLSVMAISALSGVLSLENYRYSIAKSQNSYLEPVHDLNARLLALAQSAAPSLTIIKINALQGVEEANDLPWRKSFKEGQGLEWFDAKGKLLVSEGNTFPNAPLARVLFYSRLNKDAPVIEQHEYVRSVSIAVYTKQADRENEKLEGYIRASELTYQVALTAKSPELELIELVLIIFAGVSTVSLFWFMFKPLKKNFQQLQHFNADVVHELRNPLTAINIAAEVMQSQSQQLTPLVAKKLAVILSCTEQLTRLVDDLSMLSKLDKVEKDSRIHHSLIPLDELLEDLVERFEPQAEIRKIYFESHLPTGIFVTGDAHQLCRLFSNLLENAFKYTAAGGRIALMLRIEKRFAVVHIEDTGIGIPQESIPLIFERFWRSDKARHKQEDGLGLGLAIAKSIVDRHSGQIKVRSTVGVGSSFRVYLPLAGTKTA
ncbi:HAMP domain-containing sensor histidine kinase [Chlorogloeopsis sp. ULAP01]|uniref:sensor histidine kinase n=1 Tax=Chlorogloeopsis sp. ULAP01 TaxID=3056483 RepID=UPI0025AB0A47|nr:HAMP domain-containing sensor histidine kinase [Chlorogloeopsis sp. ULAP01]MDM9381363.1 HAMP domain-containing sensor histidine kinase [Chlorogloeopsis sp. ULAP01]